jgi:hypothetical protein
MVGVHGSTDDVYLRALETQPWSNLCHVSGEDGRDRLYWVTNGIRGGWWKRHLIVTIIESVEVLQCVC